MIEHYLKRHEQFLELILNNTIIPAPRIREALHYSLFPGGKRIRPILVYLVGNLIEVDLDVLDVISAAIELTHCYSLIHDDLPAMDDDDLRRGKPSCHIAYDEATAILVGDGMQALAIEVLITRLSGLLSADKIVAVIAQLVAASGVSGMVSGQSLDLSEMLKTTISEKQLREIHHLKTGCLILSCIEMVLAAKNSIDETKKIALRVYARHLGLVFQMQDDYLDYYASSEYLGKGRSSDKANNKNTFASLLNQQQLEDEIALHYHIAQESLALFDNKAQILLDLTKELQQRSRLN